MANYIEERLKIMSEGKSCDVLYTHWQLTKDYVPKVQSVIIRTFPHFSLHDASHSETILDRIVRILGKEAVDYLSPVDLWLLLSASYYHDIGMAVFESDIEETLKDDNFISFVKGCQIDKTNPLYPFADCYEVKPDGLHFKDRILHGVTYDSAKFLLAEFIRRRHSERSKKSLTEDSSIRLPGDPIPNRLIRLLGDICEVHTKDFNMVMDLPYCELGLGTEDCHPRFVACMLRLGDLLDIDNNRFSSVLLKTIPVVPRDSLLHKAKHLSIVHLRIDHRCVEVSAKCNDYDVADITNKWLEMISNEFRRQRDVWQDIIPEGYPTYLPVVGELKVALEGYDTIDGKTRPGFEIDAAKAIGLLQGAGLYSDPAQCIRELLQNAVDATYIAIYKEQEPSSLDEFRVFCKQKKVIVDISRKAEVGDNIVWMVRVEDYGIGMNKNDLQGLARTGSKNAEKQQVIERMPEYMRPSGTFGIGFQSVFLKTDSVRMVTRKKDNSTQIRAELYNPAGLRNGAILLRTEDANMHMGTILEFEFTTPKTPDHWRVSSGERYVSYVVYSYDFIKDKTLDIDTARIIDEVLTFASANLIPIQLTVQGKAIPIPDTQIRKFSYFSIKEGIELSIEEGRGVELFYRNQLIRKADITLPYLSVSANILSGDAKDILTLNRNELCYPAKRSVRQRVINAIIEALKNNPEIVPDTVKQNASMFVNTFCASEIDSFPSFKDVWKGYIYKYRGLDTGGIFSFPLTFSEIIEKSRGRNVAWFREASAKSVGFEEKEDLLVIRMPAQNDDEIGFLLWQLESTHPYIVNSTKGYLDDISGIILSETKIDPISDWETWVKKYVSGMYGRSLMACNDEFAVLQINDPDDFMYAGDSTMPNKHYPKMICPYARVMDDEVFFYPRAKSLVWDDSEGDLYIIVYDHRADPSVTIDDIKDAYARLRSLLDPIISNVFKA